MFKNWLIKQLTEPTAWLCFIIILILIFTRSDTIAICTCIAGILMDEEWMKKKCAEIAPGITKKINEWSE